MIPWLLAALPGVTGIVRGPDFAYAVAIFAPGKAKTPGWGVENDAVIAGARVSRLWFDYFFYTSLRGSSHFVFRACVDWLRFA